MKSKQLAVLLSILFLSIGVYSCSKKDKTTTTTPTPAATACNGKNFCMKMDGTQITQDAKWKLITDRYRIYWEEGSGNNYKNIELDIYATAVGTYPINANPTAGNAGFQYYIKDNATVKNIQGESGTVEITSIANDKISGKFTITAKDGGTTYQITEGNFVNVPK